MEVRRGTYGVLVGKPQEDRLEDLGVSGGYTAEVDIKGIE
jgi:hypothetical protein